MKNIKKPAAFVAAAIGVFALLCWLKFNVSHKLTSQHTGLRGVLESSAPVDFLFIGSSHTRMSYDMKRFCKETGTNSYVLAYNGASYYFMYPILKHLLEDAQLKPKAIVVENYVVTASTTPMLQDKWMYLEAPPKLKKSLLTHVAGSPNGLNWRERYELMVSSKNQDLLVSPLTERFLAKAFYHGSRLVVEKKIISKERFDKLTSPLEGEGTVIDPEQLAALKRILELLKTHAVHAVFVESPVPGPTESDAQYAQNKRVLQDVIEAAGFDYLDGAVGFPVDDHTNFRDAGHLSAKGRDLFTNKIIEALQRQPATNGTME